MSDQHPLPWACDENGEVVWVRRDLVASPDTVRGLIDWIPSDYSLVEDGDERMALTYGWDGQPDAPMITPAHDEEEAIVVYRRFDVVFWDDSTIQDALRDGLQVIDLAPSGRPEIQVGDIFEQASPAPGYTPVTIEIVDVDDVNGWAYYRSDRSLNRSRPVQINSLANPRLWARVDS